jgi:hypothetical protein
MKLSQLTITKSLAAEYASSPPAHKVLADRIAARDPGNAPSSGDRLGFVYVKPPAGQQASKLQGDRVETPAWIIEKKLVPDAEYYIEHQLMNPLSQLFGLLLEKMPGFVAPSAWAADPEKLIGQREDLACNLLFREGLQAYKHSATRDFIAKIGLSVGVKSSGAPSVKSVKAMPSSNATLLADAFAGAPPKKQSSLDSFFKETAMMGDERLAKEMSLAKRANANAKAKAKEKASQ